MLAKKRVGLVAHDGRKPDLTEWVKYNETTLAKHTLCATGTTGTMLMKACPSLVIERLKSGPLGGDQQLGAKIAMGELDILIFLIDPMTTQPHDVDVKALTRLSTVYNIVLAMTRSTADFVIRSSLFDRADYNRIRPDYDNYINRGEGQKP